ncbi:MAG: hypothetical protein AAB582_04085 [Patescibacteria group bacterium]
MKFVVSSLFALTILAVPFPAEAMVRPVFISTVVAPNTTAARWLPFEFALGAFAAQTTEANAATPAAINGSVANLRVVLTTAPGAGTSYAFAFYVAGADTALTCTISDAATSCNDTTHTGSFSAGDLISWHITPTGTPAATTIRMSATLEGDTAGETMISGATRANESTTNYYGPFGGNERTTEAGASVLFPTNGTIDRLYARITNTASGGDYILTFNENGSASALAATIPNGSAAVASDVTDSITITTGDLGSVTYSMTGTPLARGARWSMRWRPTIDGEFPLMISGNAVVSSAATRYQELQGTYTNNATEVNTQFLSPIAFTLKKANWTIEPEPGVGNTWDFKSRINGADGTLAGQLTSGNTNVVDNTNSDPIAVGDLINWTTIPVSSPTSPTKIMFSAVAYIAPPATVNYGQPRFLNLGTMILNAGKLIFQ